VTALLTGEPLEGLWFDRTKEYAARRRGEDFDRLKYATVEALTLDPLPYWSALSEDLYRKRIASLLAEIEAKARAQRQSKGGIGPLGRAGSCPRMCTANLSIRGSPLPLAFTLSARASARRSTKSTPSLSTRFVTPRRNSELETWMQSFRPEAFPPLSRSLRSLPLRRSAMRSAYLLSVRVLRPGRYPRFLAPSTSSTRAARPTGTRVPNGESTVLGWFPHKRDSNSLLSCPEVRSQIYSLRLLRGQAPTSSLLKPPQGVTPPANG
jgi:hypothetical protein